MSAKDYKICPALFNAYIAKVSKRDPNKMLDLIKDMELLFTPGERFQYSNTNYLAIGILVEKISGESFENYLENMIKPKSRHTLLRLWGSCLVCWLQVLSLLYAARS